MNFLDIIQAEHKKWTDKNFPGAPAWQSFVGMTEELGELAHAFLKNEQGIRLNEDHEMKMKDAIGDIIIYSLHFCSLHNWQLSDIIRDTWQEVRERDWQKNKKNGLE